MPAALHSRSEVVALLLNTFRTSGYDGTSLADIAAATGLGRSSLYHYFPGGKEEMAMAVFDLVDQWLEQNIVEPSQAASDPAEKLSGILNTINIFYDGGQKGCFLGAFASARHGKPFQGRLSATFEKWVNAFAFLAGESGANRQHSQQMSREAVMLIQGGVLLAGATSNQKTFQEMLARLPRKLLLLPTKSSFG